MAEQSKIAPSEHRGRIVARYAERRAELTATTASLPRTARRGGAAAGTTRCGE
jgi:hypothetical protein